MNGVLGSCDLAHLRRRRSYKWTAYPGDVLPAFVAEMDFDVAEPIVEALSQAVGLSDFGYPNPTPYEGPGSHEGPWRHDVSWSRRSFGESFATFAATRWGWPVDPARVLVAPDVMTAIAEVLTAVTEPGAGVVINPPVYPPFFSRVSLSGRRWVQAPLARDEGGSYHLDLDALEAALAEDGVGAYLLCNPHNPVGRVWSRQDLLRVADLCLAYERWLLVDEIHSPLVMRGAEHVPVLSLDHEVTGRSFAFVSASKGWNIPGLKCAGVVPGSDAGSELLRPRWEALLPSHLGVLASVAAFDRSLSWLDAVVSQLDENRLLLSRLLAEQIPSLGYVAPEAGYLAWLDCRDAGLGSDPAELFLKSGRVALSPGPAFGEQGQGHARLNIGTSPALVGEAVSRMATALRRD